MRKLGFVVDLWEHWWGKWKECVSGKLNDGEKIESGVG